VHAGSLGARECVPAHAMAVWVCLGCVPSAVGRVSSGSTGARAYCCMRDALPPPPHTHSHTHTDAHTHVHPHHARTHTHTHTRTRTHTHTTHTAASALQVCAAGKYQDDVGESECKDCESGRYQPNTNATTCLVAEAGTTTQNRPWEYPAECGPGTYQPYNGSTICDDCPEGFVAPHNKSTKCDECTPGHACPSVKSAPIPCDVGYVVVVFVECPPPRRRPCFVCAYVCLWVCVRVLPADRTDMMCMCVWAVLLAQTHPRYGRIHGSQLRAGANAGQHTPTRSLPPSHHCLNDEVYRGNRHYNVCEHVGLDPNQTCNNTMYVLCHFSMPCHISSYMQVPRAGAPQHSLQAVRRGPLRRRRGHVAVRQLPRQLHRQPGTRRLRVHTQLLPCVGYGGAGGERNARRGRQCAERRPLHG
jgi:hypothetical protein